MTDDALQKAVDTANGEAMFAGFNAAAIWTALIKNGLVPKEQVVSALDGVLLMLEKHRISSPTGAAPVDDARSRTEALLGLCSKM